MAAEVGPSLKKSQPMCYILAHELKVGMKDCLALVYIIGKNVCNHTQISNDLTHVKCPLIILWFNKYLLNSYYVLGLWSALWRYWRLPQVSMLL